MAAPYYTPEQIAAWAPIPPDAARWQERLAHLHTIVAESDGLLAGFASYTLDGYLDFLFTHPAFARHGVASSLYHRVESALHAVKHPEGYTLASLAARPFFDRHGFQLDSEECVECRGAYLRRFAMHTQLLNERIVSPIDAADRESLCFLLVLATGSADSLLVKRLRPALMRLRHVYLGLCVLGVVVPYSQFIPWLMQHGLDMDLFMRELFATRIGAFFAFDVVVSALALFVFIFTERTVARVRHVWLPVVATLVVGVSLGLPLFLYMRQRSLDATTV